MSVTDVINQIKATGAAPGALAEATPEQLKSLAAQFESLLVSEMLKDLRSSMFESGSDSSTSSAPLADTLFAELSLAISRAGGLGFGDFMVTAAENDGLTSAAPPAPEQITGVGVQGLLQSGPVSSEFGWRKDPINGATKFHKGMDIALPKGTDVPAPEGGRVVFAGEQSGYGKTVVVDHGQMTTRYAHLSGINVTAGDSVAPGQLLGKVGATGRATGAHLHVEVVEAGQYVNPADKLATYMASRPQ